MHRERKIPFYLRLVKSFARIFWKRVFHDLFKRIIDELHSRLLSSFIMLSLSGDVEISLRNDIPSVCNRWLFHVCLSNILFYIQARTCFLRASIFRWRVLSFFFFAKRDEGLHKEKKTDYLIYCYYLFAILNIIIDMQRCDRRSEPNERDIASVITSEIIFGFPRSLGLKSTNPSLSFRIFLRFAL